MRLATVEQCREIDSLAQKVYGITGEVLMESAGALAAREIDQAYYPELSRGVTGIVCGPGNNGGDALVVARHLHSAGHRDLLVVTVGEANQSSALFRLQLERLKTFGIKHFDISENPQKLEQLRSCTLLIDGVFGIGLNTKVEEDFLKVIDIMNSIKSPTISLDCPSGLDCNKGRVLGAGIQAEMTLSFGLAKPGFFVSEGPRHVGKLRVLPIGHAFESLRGVATTYFAFNEKLARRYLPSRKDMSNKSDHGRLVVFAGSEGLWGAGILASSSAYRMGAGYVTWSSFVEPSEQIKEIPEVLTCAVEQKEKWLSKEPSAVVVGPGLGTGEDTKSLIQTLLAEYSGPVVLDADGLTVAHSEKLFPLPSNWIITPHSGELARLLGIDAVEVDEDRYSAALKAAEIWGCHVLLKGYRTVIAYKERCMVINAGNSALAKAGTGDVLAGMIGGLLTQGVDSLQAASAAAYIHGRMADEWVRVGNDKRSLSPVDLKEHLPNLMSRIAGGALL